MRRYTTKLNTGLPHGHEKSGNQKKLRKTKKKDKSQEKTGENRDFEKVRKSQKISQNFEKYHIF